MVYKGNEQAFINQSSFRQLNKNICRLRMNYEGKNDKIED